MTLMSATEAVHFHAPLSCGAAKEHVPRMRARWKLWAARRGKIFFTASVMGWMDVVGFCLACRCGCDRIEDECK